MRGLVPLVEKNISEMNIVSFLILELSPAFPKMLCPVPSELVFMNSASPSPRVSSCHKASLGQPLSNWKGEDERFICEGGSTVLDLLAWPQGAW